MEFAGSYKKQTRQDVACLGQRTWHRLANLPESSRAVLTHSIWTAFRLVRTVQFRACKRPLKADKRACKALPSQRQPSVCSEMQLNHQTTGRRCPSADSSRLWGQVGPLSCRQSFFGSRICTVKAQSRLRAGAGRNGPLSIRCEKVWLLPSGQSLWLFAATQHIQFMQSSRNALRWRSDMKGAYITGLLHVPGCQHFGVVLGERANPEVI